MALENKLTKNTEFLGTFKIEIIENYINVLVFSLITVAFFHIYADTMWDAARIEIWK